MNPYHYSTIELKANLRLKQKNSSWLRYAVDFPSAHPTRHEKNNTARGEYFQPRNVNNAPLVILTHGMGDQRLIPCKLLARALAKRGMACFVLYHVFHSSRMPETVSKRLHALTPEEWFENYQVSVTDIRQIVDWAGSRSEIDKEKIAVIGISFGGFISAIAMAIDKRIKAGVFIVSGGNGEKIARKGRKGMLKKYRPSEAEYASIQDSYARYLAEVAEKGVENVIPARKSFLTDPLTFTSCLHDRPVLMLNALWDEYVPREATLDFWEASGKPDIHWFPATHSAIWLWYPSIERKITRFLISNFGLGNRYPE